MIVSLVPSGCRRPILVDPSGFIGIDAPVRRCRHDPLVGNQVFRWNRDRHGLRLIRDGHLRVSAAVVGILNAW